MAALSWSAPLVTAGRSIPDHGRNRSANIRRVHTRCPKDTARDYLQHRQRCTSRRCFLGCRGTRAEAWSHCHGEWPHRPRRSNRHASRPASDGRCGGKFRKLGGRLVVHVDLPCCWARDRLRYFYNRAQARCRRSMTENSLRRSQGAATVLAQPVRVASARGVKLESTKNLENGLYKLY